MQENRCPWCCAFENISRKLQNPQYTAFCITRDSSARDLTLPDRDGQDVSLLLLTEDEAAKQIAQDRQMIRLYGKNRTILGAQICTRLDLCDYYASNLARLNCLGGNSEDSLIGNETQSGTHERRRPEMVHSAPAKSNHTDVGKQIARKTQRKKRFCNHFQSLDKKIRTSGLLNPMKSIRRPANPCATSLCGTFTSA